MNLSQEAAEICAFFMGNRTIQHGYSVCIFSKSKAARTCMQLLCFIKTVGPNPTSKTKPRAIHWRWAVVFRLTVLLLTKSPVAIGCWSMRRSLATYGQWDFMALCCLGTVLRPHIHCPQGAHATEWLALCYKVRNLQVRKDSGHTNRWRKN